MFNEYVMKAKAGNKVALFYLIEALKPIRVSLCRRFSSLSSEDLDQDLILVLIEAVDDFKEGGSSFPWFVRERSRYFCLDLIKERKCSSLDDFDENGKRIVDSVRDDFDLEDFVSDFNLREKILLSISRLPSDVRFVIYFHFFRGDSLSVISKRMGVSVSTVSRLKKRGLRLLRPDLRDFV